MILSLAIWYASERSISVDTVNTPRVVAFYWTTITFSQTLGTALGDWMAAGPSDPAATTGSLDLGYGGGALVFAAALAICAALYHWTNISRTVLFWAAFILTRPLGATVGDFLDRIPERFLEPGVHDPSVPLPFDLAALSERIGRSETAIPVNENFRRIPDIFRADAVIGPESRDGECRRPRDLPGALPPPLRGRDAGPMRRQDRCRWSSRAGAASSAAPSSMS